MNVKTYADAVNYIENIPLFGPRTDGRHKSGNDNLLGVLQQLKNPHKFVRAIHVAGTNGKGSTSTMLANLLAVRGYRVGVFTSPHLVTINERIAIQYTTAEGKIIRDIISNDDFLKCYYQVSDAMTKHVEEGGSALSYFEFLFAMAACYFEIMQLDYVIYETGLGGRLDATNTIRPEVCLITSIGLDHMQYLGDTISKIAFEKAGIIKKNVPVLYLTGDETADDVISKQAKQIGAEEINVVNSQYIINELTDKTIDFSVYTRYYKYNHLILHTTALYQIDNARLAIEACNVLLGEENVLTGHEVLSAMEQFFWSGRMEEIRPNVYIDGAHNPDAIARFVETVQQQKKNKTLYLMFAVAGDKDYRVMIEQLCRGLDMEAVYVTAILNARKVSPKLIAEQFKTALTDKPNTKIYNSEDMKQAYKESVRMANEANGSLYCVGSLYLVGSLKQIDAEVFQ